MPGSTGSKQLQSCFYHDLGRNFGTAWKKLTGPGSPDVKLVLHGSMRNDEKWFGTDQLRCNSWKRTHKKTTQKYETGHPPNSWLLGPQGFEAAGSCFTQAFFLGRNARWSRKASSWNVKGKVGERDHGNGTTKCTHLWIVLRETLQVQPEFLHVFTNRYAAVL